jgi:hypothetical protein
MILNFLWSKGYIKKNDYSLKDTNYVSSNEDIIKQIKWCCENTPGFIWIRTTDTKNKNLKTDLDFFSDNLDLINKKSILITSDGDRDMPSSYQKDTINNILSCKNIVKWFTQNLDLTNCSAKFRFYPIGINFHHKQIQMNLCYSKIKDKLLGINSVRKKNLRIFCDSHLNITHPERSEMYNKIKNNQIIHFLDNRVDFDKIHDLYSNYQFILSPRGNGVDCYRTWEAFLLGAIVITKSSSLDRLYIDNNLPVVILEDWNQLNCENIEDKLNKWKDTHIDKTIPENILPKFKIDYWIKSD